MFVRPILLRYGEAQVSHCVWETQKGSLRMEVDVKFNQYGHDVVSVTVVVVVV